MIWRVCERFNMCPFEVEKEFSENTPWQIAQLLAYENIREIENVPSESENKKS